MAAILSEKVIELPKPTPFVLGIVGTRLVGDRELAESIIEHYIRKFAHLDLTVISGGAAGVDSIAEEVARRIGVKFISYRPARDSWMGYRERNKRIAEECDLLIVIRWKNSKTYGSGWTRDYAKNIGKRVVSIEIEEE